MSLSNRSRLLSRLFMMCSLALVAVAVRADTVACVDNADCRKGEVCIDTGSGANAVCVKRCAPLRIQLTTAGKEAYSTPGGTATRYKLTVSNWRQFPDALFALSPDLPPCGQNTNASRSWVEIYDADAKARIYGFCALPQAQRLTQLWFGVAQGGHVPAKVHITLDDRRTGRRYCSNVVSISSD